jgi:hypothetical protein
MRTIKMLCASVTSKELNLKIDYEYVGKILETFLENELPTLDWKSFDGLRGADDHKFVFHIEIMVDKGLIIGALKNKSIGISRTYNDYIISVVPWRLTSDGHDFANALTKPSILSTIQKKFKDEGLSAVISISKKIAEKQALKLLEE